MYLTRRNCKKRQARKDSRITGKKGKTKSKDKEVMNILLGKQKRK